jgi:hypothetical protein
MRLAILFRGMQKPRSVGCAPGGHVTHVRHVTRGDEDQAKNRPAAPRRQYSRFMAVSATCSPDEARFLDHGRRTLRVLPAPWSPARGGVASGSWSASPQVRGDAVEPRDERRVEGLAPGEAPQPLTLTSSASNPGPLGNGRGFSFRARYFGSSLSLVAQLAEACWMSQIEQEEMNGGHTPDSHRDHRFGSLRGRARPRREAMPGRPHLSGLQ